MNNLKNFYNTIVIPKLLKQLNYCNIHQVPKLKAIIINSGLGLKAQNRTYLQKAIEEIRLISGQHPILTLSKKSIATFKLRKDSPIGLKVTLRNKNMYQFLERLLYLTLPRIQDFSGLKVSNFDKFGNYNFGIADQLLFPEIDYELVDQKRGFNISIIITNQNPSDSLFLLKELNFPFSK
jgi:large subunit ribosomal protein L5